MRRGEQHIDIAEHHVHLATAFAGDLLCCDVALELAFDAVLQPPAAERVANLVPVVLDLVGEGAGELEAGNRTVRLVQPRKILGHLEFADPGARAGKPRSRILDQRPRRRLELLPDVASAQRDARRAAERHHRCWRNAEQYVAIERNVVDGARQDPKRVKRA